MLKFLNIKWSQVIGLQIEIETAVGAIVFEKENDTSLMICCTAARRNR